MVKVLDVPQPTAVIASMSGGEKAGLTSPHRTEQSASTRRAAWGAKRPPDPAAIRRVAEVRVGRNPTCLAYQKYSSDTILAVSRGTEIAWIQDAPPGPRVIRRLRDARMLDPVFVEVADTHGIETPLLTVADFHGRKIINYRYGQLIFATQGGAGSAWDPRARTPSSAAASSRSPVRRFASAPRT